MPKRRRHFDPFDRRLAVISVRATGFDPHRDRLIEVAACMRFGVDDRPFHRLVNPGVPILPAATEVHGLTDADVADAPAFGEIARALERYLGAADLAGFGIHELAVPLLAAEFRRCHSPFKWYNRSVVDVREVYLLHRPCDLRTAVGDYLTHPLPEDPGAAEEASYSSMLLDELLTAHEELPVSASSLSAYPRARDRAGLFCKVPGGPSVFASGRYRGRTAPEVARLDPEYLKSLLGPGCLFDAEGILEEALAEVLSIPPPPL